MITVALNIKQMAIIERKEKKIYLKYVRPLQKRSCNSAKFVNYFICAKGSEKQVTDTK